MMWTEDCSRSVADLSNVNLNARRPSVPTSGPRKGGWFGRLLSDWDLLVLLALILADFRIFEGSSVASFTLYELFAWGYCTPYVVGHMLGSRRLLNPAQLRFVSSLGFYLAWIVFASVVAMVARGHSDVLQQAKNIVPTLPLVCFIFIRVRQVDSIARVANVYVIYCLATFVLALIQLKYGAPYYRLPLDNDEYKLGFDGRLVENIVVGFSGTQNELAMAVLPGLMFSAVKLFYEVQAGRLPRLTTIMFCLFTGMAFLLAQSRGAAVWFVFGFTFFVAPTRHSRSFPLKLALVAILVVILVGYGLHATPVNASDIDNTVQARYLLWKTSIAAMSRDPYVGLFGDGMDFVKTWSSQIAGWQFMDAHNGWLNQALFFGWPAALLYLGIWRTFFSITDTASASGVVNPNERALLTAIRGSVLAFMGLTFFEPVTHAVFPVSQLFLLMSCGVVLVVLPARNPAPRLPSAPRRAPTMAMGPDAPKLAGWSRWTGRHS
jgi:hypothetical protein